MLLCINFDEHRVVAPERRQQQAERVDKVARSHKDVSKCMFEFVYMCDCVYVCRICEAVNLIN